MLQNPGLVRVTYGRGPLNDSIAVRIAGIVVVYALLRIRFGDIEFTFTHLYEAPGLSRIGNILFLKI